MVALRVESIYPKLTKKMKILSRQVHTFMTLPNDEYGEIFTFKLLMFCWSIFCRSFTTVDRVQSFFTVVWKGIVRRNGKNGRMRVKFSWGVRERE